MVAIPVAQWLPGMDITAGRLESMNQSTGLTVTNYGADPSGAVNSDAAIQLALNDARDRGGALVQVPPGIYLLGATLRIYGNTRLSLAQGAEFRRNHGGTMLLNGDAGQSFGGYTGYSNITIEGGLWNMRGTTPGMTSSAMCISIGHTSNVVVRDLEIRDLPGYHGVEFNSTIHGRVTDCLFRGYIDPGGRDFSEAVQIDLAKSSAEFGGFGPYDHTPSEDIAVTGCYFGASGTAGTTSWPRGVGSHAATITKYHRRIRISDNTFEGILQYAVSAYNWEDVTVTGNTFNSCGSSVRVRSVILTDTEDTKLPDGTQTSASQVMRNYTITGNTMREGTGYDAAIIVRGETSGTVLNVSIVGNTIDTTTAAQHGIQLVQVSRVTVGNNVIANVSGSGISTDSLNNTVLSGNTVWTPAQRGITIIASDNSSVVGNQVRDSGNEGILLQTSSYIQVRDNFVKGASKASNGASSGIRLSASQDAIVISGNTVRPNSANTNKTSYGLSIDNTCTNISRWGNDCRQLGGTNANGSISDTVATTVATDLT
jgi:parallel beta-helix repeat protein